MKYGIIFGPDKVNAYNIVYARYRYNHCWCLLEVLLLSCQRSIKKSVMSRNKRP